MLEGDGGATLGQVRTLAVARGRPRRGRAARATTTADVRTRLTIRLARGDGVILDRDAAPFHDHLARAATAEEVAGLAGGRGAARGRAWRSGSLSLAGGAPMTLDAGGFDRHTFLCGQSGSGKSYALGLVLEQLLLETDLRIVILDPNSDCARLGELRDDVPPELAERWAALAPGIRVRSAESPGAERLRLRFGELGARDPGGAAAARPRRRPRGVRGAARAARRVAAGEPVGARGVRPSRGAAARAPARQPGPGGPGRVGARRRGLAARRARRPGGALPRRRHRVAADARGAGAGRRERAPRRVGAPARAAPAAARHRRGPQRVPRGARPTC